MVFNRTQKERKRSAAHDLALKLKLERELVIDVRDLFNEMSRDMKRVYVSTGNFIQARSYQEDLEKFLKRHYKNVSRNFKNQLRGAISKSSHLLNEHKSTKNVIDDEINRFIEEHALFQSVLITATNQEDINKAIKRIRETIAQDGNVLTIEQMAEEVANEFEKLALARSINIATTETQSMAEKSKLIEAETLAAAGVVAITEKEWVAILDNNTRLGHAIADGQVKNLIEPFNVSGESLMAPGDSMLGASPFNICNCRCSSVYIV